MKRPSPSFTPSHQPTSQICAAHELARIVADLLGTDFQAVDGKYGMSEHSWIVNAGWAHYHILDVYSVGCVPPVRLIDAFPTPKLYRAEEPKTVNLRLIDNVLRDTLTPKLEDMIGRRLFVRAGGPACDWWKGLPGKWRHSTT